MTDIQKLKALAEAATPSKWSTNGSYIAPTREESGTAYVESWRSIAMVPDDKDRAFIAAANPAAVLELIAEIERLERNRDMWKGQVDRQAEALASLRSEATEWKDTVKFNQRCWGEERTAMIDKLQATRADLERLQDETATFEFVRHTCKMNEAAIKDAGHETIDGLAQERDQLKAENEGLKANASLISLLPELDEALEDLEIHGQHSDQGYRKLKDWYRKIALACKAIDATMSKEAGHD